MADSAKDLMAQNLPGSGDKDKKDAPSVGGTVPQASDESNEEHDDADDQDETDRNDESTDDDLPEGSKTAVIPPATDAFGSLDDEAKGKADGNKTVNLRDGPESGGSGDSGGNKPPAPPGGDDGKAGEGGDGKPVNEILAAMQVVKDKLGILVPAHEKANQMQDTIGVLLQRLKMYEANPPSDLDLTALKALVATIAALVDAGHGRIDAAHKRPELDAALAYLKG